MGIVRTRRKHGFSIIDNDVFKPQTLSWEAQGMLSNILSKPDGWSVLVNALVKATEGTRKNTRRTGVYTIIRELKEAGFVQMVKHANGDVDYNVFDSPQLPVMDNAEQAKKPDVEKPDVEKPDVEKPHALVSTDSLVNTNLKVSPDNPFSEQMEKYGVDQAFIDEILKHRREIKSRKPTPKAMNLILKNMVACVEQRLMPSMNDALNYLVNETVWQTLKPEYLSKKQGNNHDKPDIANQLAEQTGRPATDFIL